MSAASGARWGDLRARVVSALVMLVVGGGAVWIGGGATLGLAVALVGFMMWELARICAPARPRVADAAGVAAALALGAVVELRSEFPPSLALLALVPAAVLPFLGRERAIFAVYGFAILLTGYGFVALREGFGQAEGFRIILWLLAVVIVSDIAGYFAGRLIGGPKFWPAVSPKKTWSGTVAGWLGAMVVGAGFWAAGGGAALIVLSPLMAFAGQLGDIAESWIKRRAGVKDSSALIPGHGGFLDRFDAVIGAVLFLLLVAQIAPPPILRG